MSFMLMYLTSSHSYLFYYVVLFMLTHCKDWPVVKTQDLDMAWNCNANWQMIMIGAVINLVTFWCAFDTSNNVKWRHRLNLIVSAERFSFI